jgi:hypothetical protein
MGMIWGVLSTHLDYMEIFISLSAHSLAPPNFSQQGMYSLRSTYLGSPWATERMT